MPRKASPEHQAEYEELKLFLVALTEFLDQRRHGFQMLPSLRQSLKSGEERSFAMNLRGTRMAVNDLLEMTIDFNKDTLRQADEFLARRGCRPLTSMREQVWQKVPKILRRGAIRNDEEYYLIIERMYDVSETGFQGADRERAGRMISAYENRRPPE